MATGSSYENIVALRFLDAPVRIANSIRDLSLKGDVDYFANRHHTLSLGLLATLFEFRFVRSFNERTQLDLRQEPVLLEGYVQDEWRLGRTTRVQLGGRGTYFSTGDRLHFTPRLSLRQALSDKVWIKAGGGVYRQHLQLITTEAFSGGDFWVPLGRAPSSRGDPIRPSLASSGPLRRATCFPWMPITRTSPT